MNQGTYRDTLPFQKPLRVPLEHELVFHVRLDGVRVCQIGVSESGKDDIIRPRISKDGAINKKFITGFVA